MKAGIGVKRICALFFIACSCLIWGQHADAVSPGGTIEKIIKLGFGQTCRSGSWAPVSITLENTGARIENAVLEIAVKQGNEFARNIYQTRHSLRVDLPSGSRKKYDFTVFIESHLHPIEISLKKEGQNFFFEMIHLKGAVTDKPILVVARKQTRHDFFSSMPDVYEKKDVLAEDLPADWYGYQGVAAVIISPDAMAGMPNDRIQALKKWVENGGCLITSGGMNASVFRSPKVKEMLNVRVEGLEMVSELYELNAFAGVREKIDDGLWVNRVTMRQSQPLVKQDDMGLVLSRQVKDGCILFAAFDVTCPQFLKWEGLKPFWKNILAAHKPQDPFIDIPSDDRAASFLLDNSFKLFPGLKTAGMIIGLYVLFLAFLLRPPAAENRHLLRKTLLILTVILFSGVGMYQFMKRSNFSQEMTITRVAGNRAVLQKDVYTGVYSPYKLYHQILQVPYREMHKVLLPPKQDKQTWLNADIRKQDNHISLNIEMGRFSVFHYKSVLYEDSPLRYALKNAGGANTLEIKNYSGRKLKNCILYYNSRLFLLGDLDGDETGTTVLERPDFVVEDVISSELKSSIESFLFKASSTGFENVPVSDFFWESFAGIHARYKNDENNILLCAWPDSAGEQKEPIRRVEILFWLMPSKDIHNRQKEQAG